MRTPRALIGPAALALALALGTAACGTRVAETNPPIRITGDKEAAVPTTEADTEVPAEEEVTTTTYFYGTTPAPTTTAADGMSEGEMSDMEPTTTMGEG